MSDTPEPDYDDAETEAAWFLQGRDRVAIYLTAQRVPFGALPGVPAWSVAPYVSLWAVPGPIAGSLSFWAIYGDLPTDFLPADIVATPRDALRAFADRWMTVSDCLLAGRQHPTIRIGDPAQPEAFGALLGLRAETLRQWASDDEMW